MYQLEWPRWDHYQCTQDKNGLAWYVAAGDREWYDPTRETALPTELARTNLRFRAAMQRARKLKRASTQKDMDEILMPFLLQFGPLGQSALQGMPFVTTNERGREIEGPRAGDTPGWFLDHALNVDRCLRLAVAIKDNVARTSQPLIAAIEQRQRLHIPTLVARYHDVRLSDLYESHTHARLKMQKLLAAHIEPNLGRVTRKFDVETNKSVFHFQALIQLIYWQVADWINGERLRQCKECHAIFFAEHERQEFCPPPQGVSESRCGRRARRPKKSQSS